MHLHDYNDVEYVERHYRDACNALCPCCGVANVPGNVSYLCEYEGEWTWDCRWERRWDFTPDWRWNWEDEEYGAEIF